MRQTSEHFMDEMLKDNAKPSSQGDIGERIAEMIDKKMSEAMSKFQNEIEKINPPESEKTKVETPKETIDDVEDTIDDVEEKGE